MGNDELNLDVVPAEERPAEQPDPAADGDQKEQRPEDEHLDLTADGDRDRVRHADAAPHSPAGRERPQDRAAVAGDHVAEQMYHAADAERDAQYRVSAPGR